MSLALPTSPTLHLSRQRLYLLISSRPQVGKAPPVGGCEWFASPCAQRDGSLFRERSGSSCDEELTHSCNSGSRSCHGPLRRSGHEAVQLTDGRSCSHRNDSVLDSFCVTQCHSESDAMIFHTRGVSPTPGTLFYQVPPQVGNILSTFCRPRRRRRVRKNVLRLVCRAMALPRLAATLGFLT